MSPSLSRSPATAASRPSSLGLLPSWCWPSAPFWPPSPALFCSSRRPVWPSALVSFALVVLAVGALLAAVAGPVLLVAALVVALVLAAIAYLYADRAGLGLTHARPAPPAGDPRYHNLVEGLCVSAGLPKPELYVIDDDAANSFATGRNPAHASIVVTTGLL